MQEAQEGINDEAQRSATVQALRAGLELVRAAPRDAGTVRLIVRRPAVDLREAVTIGELDVEKGLVGGRWAERLHRAAPDRIPDRSAQVTLMNARYLAMGFALGPWLKGGPVRRAFEGQIVSDAAWAIANLGEGRFDRHRLFGSTAIQYLTWIPGTALGVLAGTLLSAYINPKYLHYIAGIGFVAIGLFTLYSAYQA